MRKYFCFMAAIAVLISGITGCGDNKTKQKLIGTDVVTATSSGGSTTALPATQNPTASSVSTLYQISYVGAGAGNVTAAPRRMSPGMYPVTASAGGLPTPNSAGQYVLPEGQLTVILEFKYQSKNVIMKLDNVMTTADIRTFAQQTVTSVGEIDLNVAGIQSLRAYFQTHTERYIPAMWAFYDTELPIDWFTISNTDFTDLNTAMPTLTGHLTQFLMDKFPTSTVQTVTGSIPGGNGTMDMSTTSSMTSGKPTNASPATMTGSGTITLKTGEVLTVAVNMRVGDNGPVGGTQSFTSSTGETGTMTFAADGSMTGSIYKSNSLVATFSINSAGTGTFTDAATGQVYNITDAKPS